MTKLYFELIRALQGSTLATAESCTGGLLGAAITDVPGSSRVYKGGVVSYCNETKHEVLEIPWVCLNTNGAVSSEVAVLMAQNVRRILRADIGISTTGLAGPEGDESGHPVGTVFIGYCDSYRSLAHKFVFSGNRREIRNQAVDAAARIILDAVL